VEQLKAEGAEVQSGSEDYFYFIFFEGAFTFDNYIIWSYLGKCRVAGNLNISPTRRAGAGR
jgi:hypothetical protein